MKVQKKICKPKKYGDYLDLNYDDFEQMFQEGLSDSEISNEFGIDERSVKKIRDDYQNDY